MNKILSYVRRCVEDYDMIQPDDRVAVGVSGGKDSLTFWWRWPSCGNSTPSPSQWRPSPWTWGRQRAGPGWTFSYCQLCREMEVPYSHPWQ